MPRSLLLLLMVAPLSLAAAEPYDLLIRDGRVVDGTGNPWFYADVAIHGDRIVAMGKLGHVKAKRIIDAKGLVVSPGFIDMHSHSDFLLLEDGDAQSKIRQGVTTEVLGEGNSAGPYVGKLSPRRTQVGDKIVELRTLGDYFDTIERAGTSTNICSYVGLNNIWQSVMGTTFDRPTLEQLKQMQDLVDTVMRDGAMGLSSQVMMPPGSLATTDNLVALCKVVAPYGGIYSTHIRNEGTGVFDSVKEAIAIGERAGVAVDIIHLKIADQQYWGRMDEVIKLIENARKRGVNVQANVYPYTRGNNNLVSIIPPWAHEGGRGELLKRLKDRKLRKRMKQDILKGSDGWYNHYTAVGGDWSRMLVSGNNQYRGLTMDRVMALRTQGKQNADPLDELFDLLIEEGGSVGTVYAHHEEADMNLALSQPWCSVGSDGSAYAIEGPLRRGNPHPRNFGTFPRVLGLYVRERKLLTLEDAVRKITSLNATKIGIKNRGLLKEGYFADVTVFDAAVIIDRATYTDPFQYNEGVEFVIVNGDIVLDQGVHTGARPGRAIRKH
jgi:N-acyl-D-aspartate/D-glutamate deacylase